MIKNISCSFTGLYDESFPYDELLLDKEANKVKNVTFSNELQFIPSPRLDPSLQTILHYNYEEIQQMRFNAIFDEIVKSLDDDEVVENCSSSGKKRETSPNGIGQHEKRKMKWIRLWKKHSEVHHQKEGTFTKKVLTILHQKKENDPTIVNESDTIYANVAAAIRALPRYPFFDENKENLD